MSWITKLKNTLRPRQVDDELADELRDHLERRIAMYVEEGLTEQEARRCAATRFGNAALLRERSRELRLWTTLETILQDIRYAWRCTRRSPAVAVTVVLSIGIAIAANTAVYSFIYAALLRPLPVPSPESLFTLTAPEAAQRASGGSGERDTFSYPLFLRMCAAAGDAGRLAFVAPVARAEVQVGDPNAPVEIAMQQFVSGEAFDVLGVPPALGRLFSREEDSGAGAHPVAVLSHAYWRTRFQADPAVAGRLVRIDGRDYRVLGVAREGFFGIEPGKAVDVWLPVTMFDPGALTNAMFNWARVTGRLAPGISPDTGRKQMQARLATVFHRDRMELIGQDSSMPPELRKQAAQASLHVVPGAQGVSGFRRTFGRSLWILFGVAAGILLIACSNVATLLLARSVAREGEMAMRVSLGAGRGRLIRQLLIESLLLSAAAGALAWAVASAAVPLLARMLSTRADPLVLAAPMDSRVLFFCAGVCAISAIVFGLIPALRSVDVRAGSVLRQTSGQSGKLRLSRLFVSVQVAFAFCLVVAASGFVFTLHNLLAVDTGFDPAGVTVVTVGVSRGGPQLSAIRQMQSRVAGLPLVQGAAFAWAPVFNGALRAQRVMTLGQPLSPVQATFYRVSSGFFQTLRIPLLNGRDLSPGESDAAEPVPSIVNRAFARRYFGSETVLGKEFRRDDGVLHRIVGVAANAYAGDLRAAPEPTVYFPMKPPRQFTLYIRSTLNSGRLRELVEREVKSTGPGIRVVETTSLDTLVGNSILREKLLAGLGSVIACLGLLLACIGLFGLLNYSVTRRTREIGIRSALGARRRQLISFVMKDLAGILAGGLSAGLSAALLLMSFSRSLLFGIKPADPLVLGTAAAFLIAAALLAAGLPARRATAIDPIVALRDT